MRTRDEINRDLHNCQEQHSIWKRRAGDWRSSWSPKEMDGRLKYWQAGIDKLNRELLDLVNTELAEANNEDLALYNNIINADQRGYRNKVAALRKDRGPVIDRVNDLNRERDTLIETLKQENNVKSTGSRNIDHDIDESVTTPGTDPEAEVKKRIQLLKVELTDRRDRAQKLLDQAQSEIDRLVNQQTAQEAHIEALNIAINAL